VLINNPRPENPEWRYKLAGLEGGLRKRVRADAQLNPQWTRDQGYGFTKRHFIAPEHEWIDLDDTQVAAAMTETIRLWQQRDKKKPDDLQPTAPSGKGARVVRPKTNGLLLLYQIQPDPDFRENGEPPLTAFAISFPDSDTARAVKYKINQVYAKQLWDPGIDD
jgi:hypothetical protein